MLYITYEEMIHVGAHIISASSYTEILYQADQAGKEPSVCEGRVHLKKYNVLFSCSGPAVSSEEAVIVPGLRAD